MYQKKTFFGKRTIFNLKIHFHIPCLNPCERYCQIKKFLYLGIQTLLLQLFNEFLERKLKSLKSQTPASDGMDPVNVYICVYLQIYIYMSLSTIMDKTFEQNSSFLVKQRTTEKIPIYIFQDFFASIDNSFTLEGRIGTKL